MLTLIKGVIFLSLIGCMHTWTAEPRLNKDKHPEHCNSLASFPQMLTLPGLKNSAQILHNCSGFSRERTTIAIIIFYQYWTQAFKDPGAQINNALNNLLIEWRLTKKPFSGYSIEGYPIIFGNASGMTLTPTILWSYKGQHKRICETSLVHELTHIAIWNSVRNPSVLRPQQCDPDHEGKKFEGWTSHHTQFIKNLNNFLCELGI